MFSFAQNTAKPWAYWWWMGSAVTKEGISQNLSDYAKAGFGGMHIIPIYGVKGEEKNFIPYLSPAWFEMLDFTVKEANKQGLGIDMTLGTGWPFGGVQVTETDAAKKLKIIKKDSSFSIEIEPTKQLVKRAAPGGEGLVVDHFSKAAVGNYFKPFGAAFDQKNYGIRAFYNDSYEVYGANWTTDFLQKFKALRHYDLEKYIAVLDETMAKTSIEKQIWADYHETISDLVSSEFTETYVDFAHRFNKIARNEAHGSPANMLDLYAQSDIPESEFFGSKKYTIPFYRQDENYEESRFGKPDVLVLKLASSAANVAGKKLVSSETATWLGNHFKVSLAQIKPIIDESFVGGINHIFYHGLPYSPPKEPFPGWLFYASTNFNQNSHFWRELPLLNRYVENCQNLLQNSSSDNEVLVYYPIYDLWHTAGKNAKTHAIGVHNIAKEGMFSEQYLALLNDLQHNGIGFDFVSDKQLLASKVNQKQVFTQGNTAYKTIVIPATEYMPLATMQQLLAFKKAGVNIVFSKQLPKSVNGFFEHEKRQKAFLEICKKMMNSVSENTVQTLANQSLRIEKMSTDGLTFIRKKTARGQLYFIANQDTIFNKKQIQLAVLPNSKSYKIYHPLTEKTSLGSLVFRENKAFVPIGLESGESVFIEIYTGSVQPSLASIKKPASELILRPIKTTDSTKNGEPIYYQLDFSLAENQLDKDAIIYLGDVRESAKVIINKQSIGTAWCLPFKLEIPKNYLRKENKIELFVQPLSANRIRDLDQQKVNWKRFYDINFVDIQYKPFDASNWQSVESGLLSPLKMVFFE
jgi:alpha-L-rhamnosidase